MPAVLPEQRPRPVALQLTLGLFCVLVFATLLALGSWQLQRRAWKEALIARVEARVHAPATPAPAPAQWTQFDAQAEAYRHVVVTGRYLWNGTVRVQASTELGTGWWLLTPLELDDGHRVLINRGFLPDHAGELPPPAPARIAVRGLLRASEPGGRVFRPNRPAEGRWYSRDVAALAAALALSDVAPFFIDADADADAGAAAPAAGPADAQFSAAGPLPAMHPVAGLTVVSFPNNHLVYALTWYALAGMTAYGMLLLWRERQRPQRPSAQDRPDAR